VSTEDLFGSCLEPFVTCGEAIGDLPAIPQDSIAQQYNSIPKTKYQKRMRKGALTIHNHQASKHRAETMAYYSLVPPGGTWLDIPEKLRKKKQGMQRWPLDGLSRAITTEPTDFIHPTLDRIPTVRELARIQSFPDRYEFLGQRTTGNKMRRLGYCAQSQQVGNAVPPLFAEALGKAILSAC
jgi:DNA (cytosine-5)-methyltransferase 1